MIKSILTSLLLATGLFAQQRQTIYTTLTPTPLTTVNPTTYFIQNNIGQTFHTVSVQIVDTGSIGSCGSQANGIGVSTGFAGELEASFNGTTYFQLPQKVSSNVDTINNTQNKIYRATTAYPFVRFRIIGSNLTIPSGCGIAIFYSGSLSASGINDSIYTTGTSAITVVATQNITTTCTSISGGSGNAPSSSNIVGLYGLTISNNNATANQLLIYGNTSCTSVLFSYAIPANSTIWLSPDLYPDNITTFTANTPLYAKGSTNTLQITPIFQLVN